MAENLPQQDTALIREQVVTQLGWLREAAELIDGKGATVEDAFAEPVVEGNLTRDIAPMPNWSEEQIASIREIGSRFGYGAEEDFHSPFSGGVRILEGGKVWKIMAEAETLERGGEHHTEIFCGSAYRFLGEDELKFLREKRAMDVPDVMTEYDFAFWLARQKVAEGKEPKAPESVIEEFCYEKTKGNPITEMVTGQLLSIGRRATNQLVQLLRIEGELYAEGDQIKERNRPNTARVITLIAEKMTANGNTSDPIVHITSNTYGSRVPATTLAGLQMTQPRPVGADMYGRNTIRGLGAPVPDKTPLNHIAEDFRLMNTNLLQLGEAVSLKF